MKLVMGQIYYKRTEITYFELRDINYFRSAVNSDSIVYFRKISLIIRKWTYTASYETHYATPPIYILRRKTFNIETKPV